MKIKKVISYMISIPIGIYVCDRVMYELTNERIIKKIKRGIPLDYSERIYILFTPKLWFKL